MPFIESSLGLVRWKGRTGQLGSSRGAAGEPGRTQSPAKAPQRAARRAVSRSAPVPPGLRRAYRAQSGEPSGQQVRIVRGPASQRRTGGHRPIADLQQPGRDRRAPRPVQRPDVGHCPQPRRHIHPQGRARGRDVGLPQHPPGRHRTAAVPDPACQHDGMTDDRAFPRPACRVAKTFHGVHRGTLLPTWEGRDPPALNMIGSHRVCYLCCRRPIDAFSVNFHLAGAPCDV